MPRIYQARAWGYPPQQRECWQYRERLRFTATGSSEEAAGLCFGTAGGRQATHGDAEKHLFGK